MRIILSILITLFFTLTLGAQTLNNIESVEYDPVKDRWLVSNSTNIVTIEANGTMNFFGTSAYAEYGMEVIGTTLFAITGGGVRYYDLNTEEELGYIPISGAQFLNGLTSDKTGKRLWATDFSRRTVHEIDVSDLANPMVSTLIQNTIQTPNGIVYDEANNRLVFVTWGNTGSVYQINLLTGNQTLITNQTGLGNMDGIIINELGGFIVSAWTPNVIRTYDPNFNMLNDIMFAEGNVDRPADIAYKAGDGNGFSVLAVPNVGNSRVYFANFTIVSTNEIEPKNINISVVPNPIDENAFISFEIKEEAEMNIFDLGGKQIHASYYKAGRHAVALRGKILEQGIYFCELRSKNYLGKVKLIKN